MPKLRYEFAHGMVRFDHWINAMLLHTLSNIANPFVPLPWLIKGKH